MGAGTGTRAVEARAGSAAVVAGTAAAEVEDTEGASCWDDVAAGLAADGLAGSDVVAAATGGRRGVTAVVATAAVCAAEDAGAAAAAAGAAAGADEAGALEAG